MRRVPPRLGLGAAPRNPLRLLEPEVRVLRSRARLGVPPGRSGLSCVLALGSAMIRQELSTSYQEVHGSGRRKQSLSGAPGVWARGSRGCVGRCCVAAGEWVGMGVPKCRGTAGQEGSGAPNLLRMLRWLGGGMELGPRSRDP